MRLFADRRLKASYPLKASIVTAAALSVLLLTGCGQKGDLYLPESSLVSSKVSIAIFDKGVE